MFRALSLALVVGLCGSWMPATWADDEAPAKPGAEPAEVRVTALPRLPRILHDAMQAKRFDEAITMIDAMLGKPDVEDKDYLRYLRIRALIEQSRFEPALAACDSFEKEHEESRWATRVRFARAEVHSRSRNYERAAAIYRTEADRLLSDGRRDELAEIYLEFANRYFDGVPADDPSQKPKPDYAKAKTFFQEALNLEPSTATRHQVEYRVARSHQELGEHDAAINVYRAYLEKYAADGTPDEKRAPADLEAKVRYELGRALLAAGRRDEARRVWQDFVASDLAQQEAHVELRARSMYRIGLTFGLPSPGTDDNLELGVAAHERFLAAFPKHDLAAKAEFDIALSYVNQGRSEEAIERLTKLVGNEAHAERPEIAEARRLLGRVYLEQTRFDEAIAAWKAFLENHPTDSHWSEVQQLIVNAEYQEAVHLRSEEKYAEARAKWETFLNKYPLDGRAPEILLEFGRMQFEQGVARYEADLEKAGDGADENAVSDEAKAFFEAAIADWRRLVEKYPNSDAASQAAFLVATTLEDRLGRLEDALAAYRKVQGGYQSRANSRITDLTSENLELVTERKFRSNEQPTVRIVTRNVETVTVKTYRVDLGDYFRKMQVATGLEGLDIALIDPDKTVEHEVAGYEKYRRIVSRVPVPLDGPGVVAVTVTAGDLESTTMVVVSDLDVVARASRNELFVFAQDTLAKKALEGVTLLVSNGDKVFGEPVTAADGVSKSTMEELKSASEVRVFAEHGGHVAFTTVNLDGLEFASGLAPRGYLHTDRPAYQPGQLVHFKGIVRWVDGDKFTFEPGEKFRLDVYDPRSRRLHSKDVELDEFGCVDDRFLLPDAVPQGNCRVHLYQPGGEQSYETTFQVATYRLEPVRIEIETERDVFYRGETIEGTIKLAYHYGSPLADRNLQYRIADGPWKDGRTNDAGEVAFSFETRSHRESTPLAITVQYPDRGIATAKTVFLATRGFAIGASTLRRVYIAGETFDVKATVADPGGEPVATDLTLDVVELVTKEGEKRTARHELKTDEEEGTASHTLRLDEPGRYLLRFTGKDRFGNDITGGTLVTVSGDDDTVRLRVLAEKHAYEVGDTAKVQLHWRNDPALALVTYEGALVLGHRLVDLKNGANELEIPVEAYLAPNFVLSVAVMDLENFHQAQSEFLVRRRLQIELKPSAEEVEPGAELKVEITTKDARGNPVAAEVSLGMIERSLLERFGRTSPFAETYFGNDRRRPAMRAASSVSFEYRPDTEGVGELLLAENRRRNTREMQQSAFERLARGEQDVLQKELAGLIQVQDGRRNKNAIMLGATPQFIVDGEQAQQFGAYQRFDERFEFGDESLNLGQLYGGGAGGGRGGEIPGYYAGRHFMLFDSDFDGGLVDGTSNDFYYWQESNGDANAHAWAAQPMYPNSGVVDYPMGWKARGLHRWGAIDADTWTKLKAQNAPQSGLGSFEGGARIVMPNSADDLGTNEFSYLTTFGRPTRKSNTFRLVESFNDGPVNLSTAGKLTEADETIVGLNGRGEQIVVNGLTAEILVAMQGDEGLELMPSQSRSETGYWNPTTVTDDKGQATLGFRMPERSTAWTLRAIGTTKDTLAGEAAEDVVAKKPLFAEVRTPLAFREGDAAEVLVEVHDSVIEKGEKIEVIFSATIGERVSKVTKSFEATGAIEELGFPLAITPGDEVEFRVEVKSGDHGSVARSTVPVLPYGLPVYASASGSASQTTLAFVQHDDRNPVQRPGMEIVVGPSLERTLFDAVLGRSVVLCGFESFGSELARSTSDVIGGVAVLEAARRSREADDPELRVLTDRLRSRIAELVAAQRDDGGWSWSGSTNGETDALSTADALWGLAVARRAGFAVPNETITKAVAVVRTAIANERDGGTRAELLHALAEADSATFAEANRLFRERADLPVRGLLSLALVLDRLDRESMATELLRGVDPPKDDTPASPFAARQLALHLLALNTLLPADPDTKKVADQLMSLRRGTRWTPERANGPAIAALAGWFAVARVEDEKYTLQVFVNDRLVEKLEVDPAKDGSRRLEVDPKFLEGTKKHRVNFDLEGRGTFSYAVVLDGFVAADQINSTTEDWTVARTYEPAQRTLDGREIPRGFGILEPGAKTFQNELTQLPVGERGHITLSVYRRPLPNGSTETLDHLVVTEPIPAGTTVLTDTISGPFERYELVPEGIRFHVGRRTGRFSLSYAVVGYEPGKYRAIPATARSVDVPDRLAVTDVESLVVLARGAKSVDEYRLTPTELYEFGKRYAEKRDQTETWNHLQPLYADYRLKADVARDVVRMLFRAALALGKDGEIVEYFETIRQRDPEYVIEYRDVLRVARAYSELGEYERSYLVNRSTIEGRFEREVQIVGWLAQQGEYLRSVSVMEDLLHAYPAESYIATATYALSQDLYGKAAEAADDETLRKARITRIDLLATSVRMVDHFLTTWPRDPAADEAAFALANTLLDLERYEDVVERARGYVERYPDSKLIDGFWFVVGYGQFALGKPKEALETCEKVAEMTRVDPETGRVLPADNKWQAIYIMGQIHHSLGNPAKAIELYEEVRDRFVDAAEAITFFTHRKLELPDVTTVAPGEEAKPELEFRNVANVNLKVYKIDLLKFGLLRRDLSNITSINLAGIRPFHDSTVKLGDGKDYRDRTKPLDLPLDGEGAYLVVCRGDDLYTSGLVLVSKLEMKVVEDGSRVRATIENKKDEAPAKDVEVTVIGSRSDDFTRGETDLRGVFVTDEVAGTVTVIAKVDNAFAFYRGPNREVPATETAPGDQPEGEPSQGNDQTDGLLDNLRMQNGTNNFEQRNFYNDLLENKKSGVQAGEAF